MERNKWYIAETPSTNQAMKEWLDKASGFGHACMYTDLQTDGRGQRGNRWESERGQNILCSFLVQEPDPRHIHALNFAAMYAVHRTLDHFGVLESQAKWPNDILVMDRKVAGILIDNSFEGDRLKHAIVGIGLNVNQVRFADPRAASMRMLTGKEFNPVSVLDQLYDQFYAAWDRGPDQLLVDANKILYGRGEMMNFASDAGVETFRVLGLTANGELETEGPKGNMRLQHPRYRIAT